jgi:hypothetical protein
MSKTIRKNLLHKNVTIVIRVSKGKVSKMMDLSGEEARLRQEIERLDNLFEKKKGKRVLRTFLVFSGVVYLVAQYFGAMSSIKDYLIWLVGAPIFAGLIMFGAMLLLLYIWGGALEDAKYLSNLKGQLQAIMRLNNREYMDEL